MHNHAQLERPNFKLHLPTLIIFCNLDKKLENILEEKQLTIAIKIK
jgi:hypothetical protein